MIASRWLPALFATLAVAGCCGEPPAQTGARLYAMGTWVELIAPATPPAEFDAAVDDIETFLRGYERDYYAWADGELGRLNAALQAGNTFVATPELADLLRTAREYARLSGGAFDPAVAPLVEAWGFHDAAAGEPATPDADTLAGLLESIAGIAALEIEGLTVASPQGPMQLDLGGIAKGRAVDTVIDRLRERGITDALVNAGGDLRVLGEPPGRHWRIGVQSPRAPTTLATIELSDGEAAFTSGDYERFFDSGSVRMHHLLDPRTGMPAAHTQAVTVIAGNGTLADAAATAIFIAGPARWRSVAAALGLSYVLRVDADGRLEATAAMRDRLQISAELASDIIMSGP